jgi:uncharacterized protein (TIGR02266 family)
VLQVYFGPSPQQVLSGCCLDLTVGGLYLQTNYPFVVDERLFLIFSLPNHDKAIHCPARVSWVNHKNGQKKPGLPPGVGVQFLDLAAEDVKAIQEYLAQNQIHCTLFNKTKDLPG